VRNRIDQMLLWVALCSLWGICLYGVLNPISFYSQTFCGCALFTSVALTAVIYWLEKS
jgi:hypothetical protein